MKAVILYKLNLYFLLWFIIYDINLKVEELLTGRGRLIRRPVDFSTSSSTSLQRTSSTEIDNILDMSNIRETEAENVQTDDPEESAS